MFFSIFLLACLANAQYLEVKPATHSVGPDGPWWPITLDTGDAVQHIDFYPSLDAQASWYVTSNGCQVAGYPQCIVDKPSYYNTRLMSAQRMQNFVDPGPLPRNGTFGYASQVMNYSGTGTWHMERITLPNNNFEDNLAHTISNDTVITFPGGATYRPISTVSLSGDRISLPYTNNATHKGNNLVVQYQQTDNRGRNRAKSFAYTAGSVTFGLNSSFSVGGYDQNKIIEEPGVYANNDVQLERISLTSATGQLGQTSIAGSNYLFAAGITSGLSVSFDPSLTYLYLPDTVCKAMATTLPIFYNKDFNLYLWNTSSIDYQLFTTSPSYLTFAFDQVSIRVPLALLNLTLDVTLVRQPEQYFPCYGSSTNSPVVLGRAFLQAATIIRNYDTKSMWLAQAPGPGFQPDTSSPMQLTPTDTKLQLLKNAPSWESTWNTLKVPINGKPVSTAPGAAPTSDTSASQGGPPLPLASLVGLIIGVFALVTIAILVTWWLWRRRCDRHVPISYAEKGKGKAIAYEPQPLFELSGIQSSTTHSSSSSLTSATSTDPAIAAAQANLMSELPDQVPPLRSEIESTYTARFGGVSRGSIVKGSGRPVTNSTYNISPISPSARGFRNEI